MDAAGSDATGRIFGPTEAVDVYNQLSRFNGETSLTFPLLVVLDACRDTPFLRLVDSSVPAVMVGTQKGADYLAMVKKLISSPQQARDLPPGEEILYATKIGDTVLETPGASRLAGAMGQTVAPNVPIKKQLFDIRKSIEDDNVNLATRDRQFLSKDGDVYYGADDWCFFGCSEPGAAPPTALIGRPPVRLNALLRLASLSDTDLPRPVAPPHPVHSLTGQVKVLARFNTDSQRKVLLDIFWCSSGSDGPMRQSTAASFGDRLAARLSADNKPAGQSQFYAIRLRELTEADNAIPGYQRNTDALYVDPVQTERDESKLANAYLKPLSPGIDVRATGVPSKDYISASFCKGAFPGTKSPTVYFQVATSYDLPIASDTMVSLRTSVDDVFVFSEAEIMLERQDAARIHYPATTEVRFADPARRKQAEAVAQAVGTYLGRTIVPECLYHCMRPKKSHNVEVWLAPGETVNATATS